MHKSKLKQISLAVCLAFMPICGFSAGLGKLNVNSGLGEPLKAEIELLALTPDELSSLSAIVAPEEAYAVQGIPRLGIHNNIRVELAKGADGSPILKLNSSQPISDPYLDMLIQVDWSSGRLLREYTILLDPPEYKQAVKEVTAPSSIISKPSSGNAYTQNQTSSDDSTAKQPAANKLKKPRHVVAETEANADATQLTTKRGDSLATLAKSVKPEGVSLDQMLVGLFEANKGAFVDNNMNRLKVGQIIKVPSKDVLTAVDGRQASKEVKVHSANWEAYRNSLAGNVMVAKVPEQNETKQAASGKISTAEDRAAATKTGPQDVVKLSAGGKAANSKASNTNAGFDAKVLALQEEAVAKEKALTEAQARTSALEAQIADMQKLLALKNQAMANAQKSAEIQAAAAKTAEVKPAEVKPAVNPSKPAEPATTVSAAPQAEVAPAKPVPPTAVAAKPALPENKIAPVKKPVPPVAEEEETGLLQSLLAGVDMLVLAAAAGVALLGIGWAYLRNKRRRDLDSFERGILTSGGLSANTVFGNTTGNASTSDTSFLTDFAQSADGGMIDTNDVDPIAEAEVYMAYGRDAQAEEILKDAIVKEPKRYELHLKLLEMYAGRKDISAFEAVAGELYTTLGSDNPTWAKVAELGVMVEPDNPLYDLSRLSAMPLAATSSDSTPSTNAVSAEQELDWEKELDLDKELEFTTSFSEAAKAASAQDIKPAQASDTGGEPAEKQSIFTTESSLNDDLNSENKLFGAIEAEAAPVKTETAAAQTQADNTLNFDLSELGSFATESVATKTSDEAPNANGLEFDASFDVPAATDELLSLPDSNAAAMDDQPESEALGLNAVSAQEQSLEFDVQDTQPTALDFNFMGTEQPAEQLEEEPSPDMSFGTVDFNLNSPEPEVAAGRLPEATDTSALSGIDLNFGDAGMPSNAQVEEIKFDLPVIDESLDLNLSQEQAEESAVANSFDFSSINLDLSDAKSDGTEVETAVEPSDVAELATSHELDAPQADAVSSVEENENPDVEIKLDLVKVYIDMEDVEGARDLLDEVIKEGGPKQRQVAEELLAGLV